MSPQSPPRKRSVSFYKLLLVLKQHKRKESHSIRNSFEIVYFWFYMCFLFLWGFFSYICRGKGLSLKINLSLHFSSVPFPGFFFFFFSLRGGIKRVIFFLGHDYYLLKTLLWCKQFVFFMLRSLRYENSVIADIIYQENIYKKKRLQTKLHLCLICITYSSNV